MISVNLSINQLIEAIQNLNETEKQQVLKVLNNEENLLTTEQQQEILYRETEYKSGSMKTYSTEEVKTSLNFKD